jgi:class 3 adenylate cyclase
MGAMTQLLDFLDEAREAARQHAWRRSYDAYARADVAALPPDDLERFADAAWWTGRLGQAIDLRERAYAGFSKVRDNLAAARLALTLSWDQSGRGAFAVSQGWFANAERLLEGEQESSEHGLLLLTRAITSLFAEGDLEAAIADFEAASKVGRRTGDRDTEVLGLLGKGRALIKGGEVEAGLALLDQATAAAVCGELRPHSTGLVYCMTISSCQELGDYRRAAEWTEEANRWCDRLEVSGFPGACRIHRAEIMRLRGDWPAAEAQAIAACEELHDFERGITAGGYYEIGEIRRRRGDFAAAEEAYRTANELGRDPQPGLALLRLAAGKVDAAVASIVRALEQAQAPLARLPLLEAQVDIALAAGDVTTARHAVDELESIVDSYKIAGRRTAAFDAVVHVASGRIKLAAGDAEGAARCLQRARDGWHQVGAPYETAQARMSLGLAFRGQGDEHAAAAELEAARRTFDRLGAKLDVARADEALGKVEARRTFLFTDIVDSSRLLATLGDEKWKKLLARHDQLVREGIAESGGEVIKHTGDGFFASFGDQQTAIEAAVAIQRALDGEVFAPDVRIGVHTGTAFRTGASSSDYGGHGVHMAARIGAAAGAAEILVSRETLDGAGSAFRVSEPRKQEIKGFEEPIEVVAVDWR